MDAKFYGFKNRPFQLTPDHRFFFKSSVHKRAASYLLYGLTLGEGFIVITGEVGAGKTTLLRHLLSTLDGGRYVAAQIVTSQLDSDAVLQMAASAFALPVKKDDKAGTLLTIQRFLTEEHRRGRRCLLVIDEAQNLPLPALEELRMLSNFQIDNVSVLQSFLVGQPQFRQTLASPDLEQLRQRVVASYHLGPLSRRETGDYLFHRLSLVGWAGDPQFSEDCVDALFRHSGGVPRRINALASRLLVLGALEECHAFTGQMADDVAAELLSETEMGRPPVVSASAETSQGMVTPDLVRRVETLEAATEKTQRTIKNLINLLGERLAN